VPAAWLVKPGESFWSIAVSVTEARLGRHATVREVDSTWRALIEANRAQLPQPRNPSLLYVDTTLTIPP
jgi:nucleoid-associated protein YgaU